MTDGVDLFWAKEKEQGIVSRRALESYEACYVRKIW